MKPYRLGVLILASNIVFDAMRKRPAAGETVTQAEPYSAQNGAADTIPSSNLEP